MTQYFRQNTIEEQGRNYGSKNLVKYQIPLLNFSELNVLIFKTRKIFSILLMSHCWRKLWSKKCWMLFLSLGWTHRLWGRHRFRLYPVIVAYIQTNETARERMPAGGLISLPQCLLNVSLSFLITLPGPAPCLCQDDPKILASLEELCQVSP